jgi:hypothetical protein
MRKPTGYGTTLALAQICRVQFLDAIREIRQPQELRGVHMEGHWDADFPQMIDAIRRNAGNPRIKVVAMPWRMMRLLSPFVPLFRELAEMRYL